MTLNKIFPFFIILLTVFSGCNEGKNTEKEKKTGGKQEAVEQPSVSGNGNENISPSSGVSDENTESGGNFYGKGDRIKRVEIGKTEKKTVKPVQNFINTDENMINNYFLLSELAGKELIEPEDFEIGSLYAGEKELEGPAELAESFFRKLGEGIVEKEVIVSDNRFFLGKIFEDYVRNKCIPDSVRIGKPVIKGKTATVSLRFRKKSGKTEGEVIIIKENNNWFISSFRGDLSLLDSETDQDKGKFEPEIYKFN